MNLFNNGVCQSQELQIISILPPRLNCRVYRLLNNCICSVIFDLYNNKLMRHQSANIISSFSYSQSVSSIVSQMISGWKNKVTHLVDWMSMNSVLLSFNFRPFRTSITECWQCMHPAGKVSPFGWEDRRVSYRPSRVIYHQHTDENLHHVCGWHRPEAAYM